LEFDRLFIENVLQRAGREKVGQYGKIKGWYCSRTGYQREKGSVMAGKYHEKQKSLEGKRVALISGATGAIGKAIARQIAEDEGFAVVVLGRDEGKSRRTVQEIRQATGNDDVYYELADVSRKSSIQALAERWPGRLDVLVNNAAATPRRRQETPEGVELQWATNVLGYFWLTQAFAETLQQSAPARVVNVASYWAGDLELDDVEFERRRYNNNTAYRQSKQANRMLTVAFAQRLKETGVTVNACHPGDVNSQLSNDLGFGGHESPDQGAETPVWLATSPVGGRETGKYFEHRREARCRFGVDQTAIKKLYETCLAY
jgi:NAD(P)-dependent dehydrogenase (short-subunit alcohol dehydrogenase family)